ncbi:MAG TPA: cupin domain-containing protein [Candidatus Acidoferrales bacterium]|jgi:quercetin dioxygenase-like cupin family protein|nr:cupin domain-containing protein [Candidatus Acidoferrales bacterium]
MRRILAFGAVAVCAALSLLGQTTGDKPVIKRGDAAQFAAPSAPGAPDCLYTSPAHGDPSTGASTFLGKFDSGCTVPWHWHTANEDIFVQSGLFQVTAKGEKPIVIKSGDYAFMPARHIHQAKCAGSKPCAFYVSLDGAFDIHYVDASGQEIPSDKALANVNKDVKKTPASSY